MSDTLPAVEVDRAEQDEETILRFRPGQRYVHLLVAVTFVALFLSGLPLIFEPLSFLAAGGWSRIVHRVAAVGFLAAPVLYVLVDREGVKELVRDSFTFDEDDRRWLLAMGGYCCGRAGEMPPQGRLNAGQKLHHAGVMVLGVGVVVSGLLLWFAKASLSESMLAWTVLIHDVSMLALVLLLIGHIYFTVVYRAIGAMHTGYVSKAEARLEHAKWVAELERQASAQRTPAPDQDPDRGAEPASRTTR